MLRWFEVIIAALIIGFFLGYIEGKSSTKNTIITAQKNQMAAADLASTKEAERLAAQTIADNLAQKLEDAANAQVPIAQCLPADRVMRLNQR
jgi:hypothetical protein